MSMENCGPFLYVDPHEPSLGARRARLYLQYATKIN